MRPVAVTKVAATLLAGTAAVALGGCGISLNSLPKPGGVSGPTYRIHAQFSDVLNLPAHAQVRNGPQVVGDVATIGLDGYQAVLGMDIKQSYKVPAGTGAEVRFDNPLGEEYVVLVPPKTTNGKYLAAGSTITEADTVTAPTVEDTLGALATVIDGGGVGDISVIVDELNQTFAGNQPQIRSLLSELNTAVTTLNSGSGAVDGALASIGNLTKQLAAGGQTIEQGLAELGPASGILASENGQFDQMITALGKFSGIAEAVANQSGQNTVTTLKSLEPVVQQIVSVDSQLGPTLQDLAAFEAQLPKVAPGNYLQVSVTLPVTIDSSPATATTAATTGTAPIMTLLGALTPDKPIGGVER